MPLKLIKPRIGKTPYYAVRGTYLGVYVDRSAKTSERATAAKFLAKCKDEIERGCFAKPGEPTFLDAAVRYMAEGRDERFLEPLLERLGDRPLKAITQDEINDLSIALYPQATAATRNRQVFTPISAVLKHAGIERQWKRPKGWRGEKRHEWLWPEQAFTVLKAADQVEPEFGLFLRTLLYTGLRLGEALRLQCDDVALSEAYALAKDTKNGEDRGVFLPPVLVAAFANHPRGMDRKGKKVFRYVKCGRLYTLLGRVEKASGLALTFHLFRHTWATWMRRYGGLDRDGLVATGAWRDSASAARYAHTVVSEESRKAILLPVEKTWKRKLRSVK